MAIAMKATSRPFVPTAMSYPCPACGGTVTLRQREGQFRVACDAAACRFSFDADKRGKALARCPSCNQGRLRATPKGRVCADCGAWDNTPSGRSSKGVCPKCKTGRLGVLKGEYGYFVGCSDGVCGLTYTCDATGRPEGGHCRVCKGPVRKTRAGSLICVVCATWQNPKPVPRSGDVPRPPAALCPSCRQALRPVWTRRGRWLYRCDTCPRWLEVEPPVAPQTPT
jgi:ssDNA-binding Zn-finger/Zn-ribbon topoisomerase 1